MTVGNEWVVPYNPYLCWKYKSHINVEVCGGLNSVKYIDKYNAAHPTEKYLFQDFPRFFTSSKTKWKRRVNPSGQIGRMHPLSPLQGEVYYLRCLLLMVPGPTSFEDLRTVNGVRHDTFENACYARGIINRDNEWELCFDKPATSRPDGNYAVS